MAVLGAGERMISLRPFRAWRPAPDKAHLVGSRSYVFYTPEQLAEKLGGNPWTFLHIIHPTGVNDATLPRSERFQRVRDAFKGFCDEHIVERDPVPCIYAYEQRSRGNSTMGIIAGVSVTEYTEGRIKVHEQTLTARENIFAEYLHETGINAEPVLLATPEGTAWEAVLDPLLNTRPDYDFSTTDRVRHRLWAMTDKMLVEDLQRSFSTIPNLYIADGHHRLASSARLAASRGATEEEPAAWCLAYIVPRSQLYIFNFDRTVATLNGLSEAEFLDALRHVGNVTPMVAPWTEPGLVAVRTASGWRGLRLPPLPEDATPEQRLDPARLSELVLGPVLGVHDLRTDPAVGFVPGTHGTVELDRIVDSGTAAVAFHLHPVSFAELKAVADSGGTMPPKSTYIEPKLRSGLTVYSLEDA